MACREFADGPSDRGRDALESCVPELPEVETVCRGLAMKLEGKRLTRVEQRRKDLRFPLPAQFARRLTGRRIVRDRAGAPNT